MFERGSRYEKVPTYTVPNAQGEPVTIIKVRPLPEVEGVVTRTILQQDRVDLLAYECYRRADLFWRIADANEVMDPAELTNEVGKTVEIPTQPE